MTERGIVDRSRLPKHADPGYQADRRERYPIDTPEHAAASWEALDDDENAAFYTPQQLILVRERIQVAMRRYGA